MQAIHTDKAPKAIGPYSQAVRAGDFLFVSGQIPIDPATGALVSGGIGEQTHQVFKNLFAILLEAGLGFENAAKVNVYMTDLADFGTVNEIYGQYFKHAPLPARAAVQVGGLPKGALIEIELIAACK